MGGQSIDYFLDTGATYSLLTEVPDPPQSASVMGLSGQAKRYYFSRHLRCNWNFVLLSHEFLIMAVALTPFGEGYTEQGLCLCFHEYGALPFSLQNVNPRVWAGGKSVSKAQNTIPIVVKLKGPHLFPHKKALSTDT